MPQTAQDDPFSAWAGEAAPAADGGDPFSAWAEPAQVAAPKKPAAMDQAHAAAADSPIAHVVGAVGEGAKEGWEGTPAVVTPETQGWLNRHGLGAPTLLATGAMKAGGAAINALASGAAQVGAELPSISPPESSAGGIRGFIHEGAASLFNPALAGRTVGAMVQNPQALTGTPIPSSGVPRVPEDAPAPPRFIQEHYGEGTPGNPLATPPALPPTNAPGFVPPGSPVPVLPRILDLIRADNAVAANRPAFVPPGEAQPRNPLAAPQPRTAESAINPLAQSAPNPLQAGVPVPNSVGASATPTDLVAMAPKEAAASRATGEMMRLMRPARLGYDDTEYVPGVRPTAAEIAGDPEVSLLQKRTRQSNDPPFTERDNANNEIRADFFDNLAGTPTIVNTMREARAQQAQKDLETAFGSKQPTDAAPVVATIGRILTNPRDSENTAVQQYVKPLLARLYDPDGTLKTDPEQLYGLREDVNRMLSKTAKAETPTLNHVAGQLQDIKGALDDVIEKGAPGYQQYLQNFAQASKPIDTMEMLQEYRPKLTNGANRMLTFGKFDKMMKDIVLQRQAGGVNPAKSIDEDTMDALWNLHSDLKRANNVNLGKPSGSDTSQLLEYGKKFGITAAHGLAAHAAPVVGNALLHYGTDMASRISLGRRTDKLLNPRRRGMIDGGDNGGNPLQAS
jgi:hypothetical protein